jgi:hypothetical protein
MEEVDSDDETTYKIESILPEKDSEDQEISGVNIEAIATNVHGTNFVVGFLCVGPMMHAKALKEKIDMILLFNQMQRQTALRNVNFKEKIFLGQPIEKVGSYTAGYFYDTSDDEDTSSKRQKLIRINIGDERYGLRVGAESLNQQHELRQKVKDCSKE